MSDTSGKDGLRRTARIRRGGHPVVAAMSRRAVFWAIPTALMVATGAWVLQGPAAGLSALIGGGIALAAFTSGIWGIGMLLTHLPGAEVAGALALYLIQVLVLVSVVLLIHDQAWLHAISAGVGLFFTALAHQIGLVTGYLGCRTQILDTPLPDDPMP